jgi:pimeloyl-ACP methyl ester carboxylesterase
VSPRDLLGDAPAPVARHVTARDGLRLGVLDWAGDPRAAPVLCLPGITRTAWDFCAIAARQAGRRRVVALDWAGHGESDRAEDPVRYRPEAAVRDVLDAMAALHLHRAVLVGTSFGGLVSMFLAVLRPALLRGVVLNDIGPRVEPAGAAFVADFVGRDPAHPDLETAAAYLREVLPPNALRSPEEWQRFAALTYRRGEDGRWHPRWDTRIAEPVRAQQGALDFGPIFLALGPIPTLLVRGALSDILSADTVARMRNQKPDLRVVTIEGVGHNPSLSEPAAAAAVDSLIADCG